jgi:hypothetical protein
MRSTIYPVHLKLLLQSLQHLPAFSLCLLPHHVIFLKSLLSGYKLLLFILLLFIFL